MTKPNQLVTQAKRADAEVRSLMEQGTRIGWKVADLSRQVRDERWWDELERINECVICNPPLDEEQIADLKDRGKSLPVHVECKAYHNFGDWIDSVPQMSRSAIYVYIGAIEAFRRPISELEKMPISHALLVLEHLPENELKSGNWIEKATTLSAKQLRKAINAIPGAKPVDDTWGKWWFETKDIKKMVHISVEEQMLKLNTKDAGWALATICAEWLEMYRSKKSLEAR